MEKWICTTCGTQYPPGGQPPEACPICRDERQYIGYNGQQWTTLAQMQLEGFRNEFQEHEPGLIGGDVNRGPGPMVFWIGQEFRGIVLADDRHPLRGAGAQESNSQFRVEALQLSWQAELSTLNH